jgi:hypothetical protein
MIALSHISFSQTFYLASCRFWSSQATSIGAFTAALAFIPDFDTRASLGRSVKIIYPLENNVLKKLGFNHFVWVFYLFSRNSLTAGIVLLDKSLQQLDALFILHPMALQDNNVK